VSDIDTDRPVEQGALGKRIKWLICLRLLLAFLFLGSATILAIRERLPFTLTPLFVLAGCTCFLTILYLLLLSRSQQLRRLCALQLWIDSVLITALVHYTGGIDSIFAFAYIFPILAAAICVSRQASLLLAGASSVLAAIARFRLSMGTGVDRDVKSPSVRWVTPSDCRRWASLSHSASRPARVNTLA